MPDWCDQQTVSHESTAWKANIFSKTLFQQKLFRPQLLTLSIQEVSLTLNGLVTMRWVYPNMAR
jgi:hypothetical protein